MLTVKYLNFLIFFSFSIIMTIFVIRVIHEKLKKYIKVPEGPQKVHKGNISRLGGLSIYVTMVFVSLFE